MQQQDVFNIITQERLYQDHTWGTIEQRPRDVASYLTIIQALVTQAQYHILNSHNDYGALDTIRQLTATGIACLEQHDAPSRIMPPNFKQP